MNIKKILSSPILESTIMISSVVMSYFGLWILSMVPEDSIIAGQMATSSVVLIVLAFFLLSTAIAMISVIAGIGGGVIFTPIMLAFTNVNSVVVRGTGLIVAMFSGLISTGIFIKKGLGNYRLCLIMTLSQSIGALIGAVLAINMADSFGNVGEGILRVSLGLILVAIAVYFYLGGKKLEYPIIKKIDKFTSSLKLGMSYYEESENKIKSYDITRAPLGIILVFVVGILGGFFGMGGGWAITPVLNMGIGMPLKLAAANSGVILGVGSCVSIWPYIFAGGILPFFVLPWLSGQVIGGFIGSYALAKVKVNIVRIILIGIMFFTSFGLITKGLSVWGIIEKDVPALYQMIVFGLIMAWVIFACIRNGKTEEKFEGVLPAEEVQEDPKHVLVNKEEVLASIPKSHIIYGNIVHWLTIAASLMALFVPIMVLVNTKNNLLNPNLIFAQIFSGEKTSSIWALSAKGGFPGAHYYLNNPGWGDSWAMLSINLGCSVAFWALIPTVLRQLFKEKDYLYGILGAIFAMLVLFSMLGVLSV